VVTRKEASSDGLNHRLGKNLKVKRVARAWKDLRRILAGLLLIMAIGFAIFVLFVRTS
jgi:hypothetical protein